MRPILHDKGITHAECPRICRIQRGISDDLSMTSTGVECVRVTRKRNIETGGVEGLIDTWRQGQKLSQFGTVGSTMVGGCQRGGALQPSASH